MSDYNFVPDYAVWWKKKAVTKEDFSWLLLGVEPEAMKKAKEISSKASRTEEDSLYLHQLDNFCLSYGQITLGTLVESHKRLLRLEWGKGKADFIKNAYEDAHDFPPKFSAYLKSINKMPNDLSLESYKDHEQYDSDLSKWHVHDIDTEDKALSLLLGLNLDFWPDFVSLQKRQTDGERTSDGLAPFFSFKPQEKWFFRQYHESFKKKGLKYLRPNA